MVCVEICCIQISPRMFRGEEWESSAAETKCAKHVAAGVNGACPASLHRKTQGQQLRFTRHLGTPPPGLECAADCFLHLFVAVL